MTVEQELAWAAGFFDGEGNTRFGMKTKKKEGTTCGAFVIQISQVDRFPLERFRQAVSGLGYINGPYNHSKNQPIFKYEISGPGAVRVYELMRPYLSTPKVAQGDDAKQRYGGYLIGKKV